MKHWKIALFLVGFTSCLASAEIVATLQTENGESAYVIAEHAPRIDLNIVSFGQLHIQIGDENFRIASSSSHILFDIICEPFEEDFPYHYNTVETRQSGFLGLFEEPVVRITDAGTVIESDDQVVVTFGYCQKTMY